MQMTVKLKLAISLLASLALASCGREAGPENPQAYVGTYAYQSGDSSGGNGNQSDVRQLTLRKDGEFILVRGGAASSSKTNGMWRFTMIDGQPTIVIDSAGYPAFVVNRQIRLLVDDDLDEWYAKVK